MQGIVIRVFILLLSCSPFVGIYISPLWYVLQNGITSGEPIEIVTVSRQGFLYLNTYPVREIIYKLDANDTLVKIFDFSQSFGSSEFAREHFAVSSEENFYFVCECGEVLQIIGLNPEGKIIARWGSKGSKNGQFKRPTNLAIDSKNNVYVVDERNLTIQKFDSTGNFLLKLDTGGYQDARFYQPSAITIDEQDNVYISDLANNQIEKYASNGKFLGKFGKTGREPGQFNSPEWLAADIDNFIYVYDVHNGRIQKFKSDFSFVSEWKLQGDWNEKALPAGYIAADRSKNILFSSPFTGKLQKINPQGKVIKNDFLNEYKSNKDPLSLAQILIILYTSSIVAFYFAPYAIILIWPFQKKPEWEGQQRWQVILRKWQAPPKWWHFLILLILGGLYLTITLHWFSIMKPRQ